MGELLNRISSRELSEWIAYASLEPFGPEVESFGHAMTAATIANVNKGKNQKAFRVNDFMPKVEVQDQTPEQMIQIAEMFTAGLGGTDLREENTDG